MEGKISSAISKITLNSATFHSEIFEPTYINYIYGKNGAGKTTIANAISNKFDMEYSQGFEPGNCKVYLFNSDFVSYNLRENKLIPGVFILSKSNVELYEKALATRERISILMKERNERAHRSSHQAELRRQAQNQLLHQCIENASSFISPDSGFRPDQILYNDREANINRLLAAYGEPQDKVYLQKLCKFLYNGKSGHVKELKPFPAFTEDSIGASLMSMVIIKRKEGNSSCWGKSENLDWLIQGHFHYEKAGNGSCPYCMQKLPAGFTEAIEKALDTTYIESVNEIGEFLNKLIAYQNEIGTVLHENNTEGFPKAINLNEYYIALSKFQERLQNNLLNASKKQADPSQLCVYEETASLINELNQIIVKINEEIKFNNNIVRNKKQSKQLYVDLLFKQFAYTLRDSIESYKKEISEIDRIIHETELEIEQFNEEIENLKQEIMDAQSTINSTATAVAHINNLLKASGFQGFRLRRLDRLGIFEEELDNAEKFLSMLYDKYGMEQYEIERPDGSVARNLSEGEMNLIGFLYFYYTIKGSLDYKEEEHEKIVVIDDPVTSMDSNSMFLVSTIIREMVDNCYSNVNPDPNKRYSYHIRQFFLLTHNAFFHREITFGQTDPHKYNAVTFFQLKKTDNKSKLIPCIEHDPFSDTPAYKRNYNPVKNSYASLWQEYNEVHSIPALINIVRQILEYYFIQLCGYDRDSFTTHIFNGLRPALDEQNEGAGLSASDYTIAVAMLEYLSVTNFGLNDDVYHIDEAWDEKQCRNVFEKIFELMNQHQHYKMMMREN